MRTYYFSENPYPKAWDADPISIRVTLPNKHFDPVDGSDLINRYIDEWVLCDELGIDIWVNEHRSTATCLTASTVPPLSILARQTKNARLLTLGATIGTRWDPVLTAEELSYVDVVSGGRLEMGLVKGYSTEIAPSNVNPVTLTERFWEAHDLILKAMTTHDGPFNWEGEHFHFRQVNIWPRPYQQPLPPVWITAFSPHSVPPVAERGHIVAGGINIGVGREIFRTYRRVRAELGYPAPGLDRFAYMALVGVGDTEEEGHRFASQVKGYLETTSKTIAPFLAPPGFVPVANKVKILKNNLKGGATAGLQTDREGRPISYATADVPALISAGAVFAGTPDQVFEQIKDLYEYVGGFKHLLAMMHGGALSHADTTKSTTLFAKEVLPRLKELGTPDNEDLEEFERIRQTAAA